MSINEDGTSALPAGWRRVKLHEICSEDRRVVAPGTDDAASRPYLSLEHIESNTGRILRTPEEALSDEGKSNTFAFDERHVLYGKLRPYLNKVAMPNFAGRCTTELIPLRPLANTPREYLLWLLRRPETVQAAMQEKTGSRMPRADMDIILDQLVPLPPLDEQRRIAAILSEQMAAVERARAATRAQLMAVRELTGAYVRDVFETDEAASWDCYKLGDIARTHSGSTPSRSRADYYSGGAIPWVKTGELKDGVIGGTEEHITDLAVRETSLRLLPPRTLLVAMYGQGQTRGRTGFLDVPATTNQACLAILPDDEVYDTAYLQWWFRCSYKRLREESEGRGGNQPNLNGDMLRNQMVPLPSLAEQRKIVARLSAQEQAAYGIRHTLETQQQLIATLPRTLLQQAFSGALSARRVTVFEWTPEQVAVFMGWTTHYLHAVPSFGDTFQQKLFALANAHLRVGKPFPMQQGQFGPFHPIVYEGGRLGMARGWFTTTPRRGTVGVTYAPGPNIAEALDRARALLGNREGEMRGILDLFKSFSVDAAEAVATVYVAWNNFLHEGVQPTDDEIMRAVWEWHPTKRAKFPPHVLAYQLQRMREAGLVPDGGGAHTEGRHG